MTGIDAAALARLFADAADTVAPRQRREPLVAAGGVIGSLEPTVLDGLDLDGVLVPDGPGQARAWRLLGDVSTALEQLAEALRAAGRVPRWRDELLAVIDAQGRRLGVVERGVTRQLGLATQAVHLVGEDAAGRFWVQQRAFDKPNDPGRWDTLMGGMVPASDSLEQALARETWEEAGLHLEQLRHLRATGHHVFRRPSSEEPGGYIVERIDWYRAQVPEGVEPINQDGEVAQFACLTRAALCEGLARGDYTWAAQAIHAHVLLNS